MGHLAKFEKSKLRKTVLSERNKLFLPSIQYNQHNLIAFQSSLNFFNPCKRKMSVAFWSTKLVAGKTANVQPPEGYVLNVTQVCLSNGKTDQAYAVHVDTQAIEGDKLESVIGILRGGKTEQFSMNLVFGYDVPTTFSVTTSDKDGKAAVYLSGYYQPAPDDGKTAFSSSLNVIVMFFSFLYRW
jgi:hypothetical protein